MAYVLAAFAAALFLGLAAYVQLRLADFTAGAGKLWSARLVLAAIGIGCGYVLAALYREEIAQLLAFVIGFGLVHLPASAILLLKALRGEGPS